MYIRINIEAQSQLSVPPAPEVIWSTALSWSSSPESMFFNSNSSTFVFKSEWDASNSGSVASPSLKKSNNTSKSSAADASSS